jgi:phospholipase/carboxylesterase
MSMTRRSFGAAVSISLAGCARGARADAVRLHARPGKGGNPAPGATPLGLRDRRDAILYVPKSLPAGPAPLLVYLHGATGDQQQGVRRMGPFADQLGFVLLSPGSEDGTWDAIRGAYGPDVRFIDRALDRAFASCAVDPGRIAVSGFSDGASYALGLGLSNGDLFKQVIAFSPGFIPGGWDAQGRPRVFISHGTADEILPIDRCSRRLVPELRRAGYDVTFREFDGPHTVPKEIAEAAVRWVLA